MPRGCSAIDVVTAIRAKFLPGRREADFVVVCDVRKEAAIRLQELNDAQVRKRIICCYYPKYLTSITIEIKYISTCLQSAPSIKKARNKIRCIASLSWKCVMHFININHVPQISLIHVCGTQKNAADEKLRQCMRRFGELHTTPAALLLISGDINFAADLSDFRYRYLRLCYYGLLFVCCQVVYKWSTL